MFEKLKITITKNIVKILLLSSLLIYVTSLIYVEIYDIPTYNTIEAGIIIGAVFIPAMIGLWIFIDRIKCTRKRLSIYIKCAIIYGFSIYAILTTLILLGIVVS